LLIYFNLLLECNRRSYIFSTCFDLIFENNYFLSFFKLFFYLFIVNAKETVEILIKQKCAGRVFLLS